MRFLDGRGLSQVLERLSLVLAGKVDAQEGMGLSQNNFTDGHLRLLAPFSGDGPGLVPHGQGLGLLTGRGTWLETGADWEETDPEQPDFIRNRPFGQSVRTVIPEQEAVTDSSGTAQLEGGTWEAGECVRLLFNGEEQEMTVRQHRDALYIGNAMAMTGDPAMDTGEALCIVLEQGQLRLLLENGGERVRVRARVNETRRLAPEWIGLAPIEEAEIEALFGGGNG